MDETRVPALPAPLSDTGVNPRMEEARQRMYAWADSYGLIPGAVRVHMDRSRMEYLSALYYPTADAETFDVVTGWILWGTLVDDVMDDGQADQAPTVCRTAMAQALAYLEHGHFTDTPVIRALDDLWRRTAEGRSEGWKRSFISHWRQGWQSGCASQMDRLSGRTPSVAEYRERRRHDIKMLPMADLLEVALHIDLHEDIRHLPALEAQHNLASDYAGLVNDLVSVDKDLALDGPQNVVTVLRAQEKCTIPEAIERAREMTRECVRWYLRAESELPVQLDAAGASGSQRVDALRYAHSHRATFNGNRQWHLEVPRYTHHYDTEQGGEAAHLTDLLAMLGDA